MGELKAGDVIDVVERTDQITCRDCVHTSTTECHYEDCTFGKDLILKLRTGPKQGDTVWKAEKSKEELRFICWCGDLVICQKAGGELIYATITTEDPYALKYTLTAQEALVAIGQGKRVRDSFSGMDYMFWDNGIKEVWEDGRVFDAKVIEGRIYAIVEE